MPEKRKKGKHLTWEERHENQRGLREHRTFAEIAMIIDCSPDTVSKEIRRHRYHKPVKVSQRFYQNRCKYRDSCRKRNICGKKGYRKCKIPCRQCNACNKRCPDFVDYPCQIEKKPPYVCNACGKSRSCLFDKYLYNADYADREYREELHESRKGIDLTKDELIELDELVSPLIKRGQPISHIFAEHTEEIPCSERTLYNYIEKQYLSVRNLDLRRKVRYKKRKREEEAKPSPRKKINHHYRYFLLPKIGGLYVFSCSGSGETLLCKACSEIKAKEDYIEEERKRKIRDSTPNNGCFNCGTKESNLFFFDYDKENWICDRCYYITNYGEEKWKEILTLKEKQRNEKIYGSIKLFMKEKQFVRIPLIERYSFDDVISYELIENGNIEKSKGIGGAIIGGALAGVPGALIGYDISKKNKNVCTEYKIIIRMKGSAPININYIGGGVPVSYDSVQFNQYRKAANETIEGIELILDMVKKENEITMNSNENQITSIADEIMKLKELLDQGIISEEEFVEGKKKLLQK